MDNKIVLYSFGQNIELEVKIEDETVWLSQSQMVQLFDSSKQNISLHITNIYKEEELEENSTIKEYLTVQKEGLRYVKRKVSYYSLDVIISVGYRVKSHRGTQFRIWANKVLRDYLLKGYAIHNRIENIEQKFDLLLKTDFSQKDGIFFEGQIFDAYIKVIEFIKEANESIILIDNYIDEIVLSILSKRKNNVCATIYTNKISKQLLLDISKHNAQYPNIDVIEFPSSYDRFLIIDNKIVYHIGASIKDLGKKWFAFSKININPQLIIDNLKQM